MLGATVVSVSHEECAASYQLRSSAVWSAVGLLLISLVSAVNIRLTNSRAAFLRSLKTHLFNTAFI